MLTGKPQRTDMNWLFMILPMHLGVFVIDDAIIIGMMIAAASATLAGTAMSFMAQREAAKQTQYNAEHNAKLEEMKAEEEKARRAQQERQERRQSLMRRASIEADFAKSGLLMTGTPSYVLEEQAKADEMNILEGDRLANTGFMRSMERAALIRQQGEFESESLKYGATTTLISGLGSVAMQGASFGAAGGFGSGAGAGGSGGTAVSGGGGGAGYNNASFGGNSLFAVA
jgi:ATPase subunit of ABC transporter with duplicated ATPase domains